MIPSNHINADGPDNAERAHWALTALASVQAFLPDAIDYSFHGHTMHPSLVIDEFRALDHQRRGEAVEQAMSDLLANLHHLADECGVAFDACFDRGEGHYLEEKEPDDG